MVAKVSKDLSETARQMQFTKFEDTHGYSKER